jgi:hypothetical protein
VGLAIAGHHAFEHEQAFVDNKVQLHAALLSNADISVGAAHATTSSSAPKAR